MAALAMVALAMSGGSSAMAKTVALIDNSYNDKFLNCGEGWVRATGLPDDNIQVGGSFTTGLGRLADGDSLIIVAHGTSPGSFVWAKTEYTDFGGAAGQMPVPAGFGARKNVTVRYVTCFSATAPTGGSSILSKLLTAMGGADNGDKGSGFAGIATTHVVTSFAGGNATQYAAAQDCIDAFGSPWVNNPPSNRPGTGGKGQPANQRSAGQALIDNNCTGVPANKLTFNLPNQVGVPGVKTGYGPPTDSGPPPGTAPAPPAGVVDVTAVCGDGDATQAPNDDPTPAPATTWGKLKSIYR